MPFDPLSMDKGGLDDVDVVIKSASFRYDEDYNDGDTLVLDAEVFIEDEDVKEREQNVLFSCGDAWTTRDEGATAERHDEKEKMFNNRSGIGIFNESTMENGGGDELRARYEATGLDPRHAAWYVGMRFHLGRKDVKYGGEIGTLSRIICEEWHGMVGDGDEAAAKPKADAAAKPKSKSKPKPAADSGDDKSVDSMVKKYGLDKMADGCEEHDEFVEKAMEAIDADDLTPELEEAINDGDSDDGIWGQAVARAS